MGQLTTRANDITPEVNQIYTRVLLREGTPTLLYDLFSQMVTVIPNGSGTKTAAFRRYRNLGAAGVLEEGITPPGQKAMVDNISATTTPYGDYLSTTDEVLTQSPDPTFLIYNELLGEQAALTFNGVARDVLAGGTQVTYQGGHTARDEVTATDVPTAEAFENIADNLKGRYARKLTSMIVAGGGQGTVSVNPSYVAIVSVPTGRRVMGLDGFTHAKNYASVTGLIHPREIGAFDQIRFVEGDETMVFEGAGASGVDVHGTLIMAREAFGTVALNSESIESISKGLGSGDDPLNQRATTGWKGEKTYIILNQDFVQRYEHTV